MEESIVFIVNPAAGKHDTSRETEKLIRECMAGDERQYVIYKTKAPGDGESYVRSVAVRGGNRHLFVACGGDGTLNEVVNGAVGYENVTVTHYPCGSGNDFIKSLRIKPEYFKDMGRIVSGESAKLDIIECGGRYSINICSVGLDARIAADVPKMKKLPAVKGSGAYMLALVTNMMKRLSEKYRIVVNGEEYNGEYIIVVAASGTHYGSGFNPIPEALPNDGILDFLLVKKISRLVAASVVNKYKQGRYRDIMKYFTRLSGKTLELFAQKPVAVNIDGEIIRRKDVRIELSDKKIMFRLPAGVNSPIFSGACV